MKRFPENLKKYRVQKQLTQQALAEKLYVTPQTVSKWEKGSSYPDAEKLFLLASALNVSIDRLTGFVPEDAEKTFIGVDGGGTKTEMLLCREDGQVLRRLLLGQMNPNVVGNAAAAELLCSGVDSLLSLGYSPESLFVGGAGCGIPERKQALQEQLSRHYPALKLTVESDIMSVFYLMPEPEKGCAVICGTGSAVVGRDAGGIQRIGGSGFRFDDALCGYTLGRDALKLTLAVQDGLAEEGLLSRSICRELGGESRDCLGTVYEKGTDYIASLAPLVTEAARQNDPAAREILLRAARELAEKIRIMRRRCACGNRVVLTGGLARDSYLTEYYLKPELEAEVELMIPELPPVYGAVRGAMSLVGVRADERFTETFLISYERENSNE